MTSVRKSLLFVLALCCLAALPAPGQAQTGTIAGTVTDAATGTAIPNATVRAQAADGSIPASGLSGDNGDYRLVVPAGAYTVVVNRLGYQQRSLPGIAVTAGATTQLSIAMQATTLMLDAQVVTSTRGRAERVLEAPASVAVVHAERIEERPALQLSEHVQDLPGVDVATTGLMTSNTVTRGFNNVFSGAMLAITDHRYTAVPSLRVNSPALVPTTNEDVERIEMLLGPGAALYGPNAANGVMHVLTQSPLTHQGTTLSLGGGERSVFTGSGRHAGIIGERLGYKISGQYMRGREWECVHTLTSGEPGYYDGALCIGDPAEIAARQQAFAINPDTVFPARDFDLERYSGELRFDYRISPTSSVILAGGLTTAANAIEMTGLGAAQAIDWTYSFYQARFFSGRFFAQAFINQSDAGDTFLLRTNQPIVDQSRMLVGQVQHGFDWAGRSTFTYGVDLQRTEPRTGGTITGRNEDDDTIDELGGYFHSEWRLSPNFDIVAAIRADHHNRIEDLVWSPRAGIVFRPDPMHNFRVTYNRAFSTPSTNNLFLDLTAGRVGPLPYEVRAVGVPEGGFAFRRDCVGAGNLCVRSPFLADPTAHFDQLSAAWQAAVNFLHAQTGGAVDLTPIPIPAAGVVGTHLRTLNPTTGLFELVTADVVADIPQLKPTISTTYEVGYKGLLGGRASVSVDVWWQRQQNFIGPLIVETPNVFLDGPTTAAYLMNFMPPAQAAALATQMAMLPAATITPDHPLTSSPHLLLTYRNFGEVDLWGSDIGIEAMLSDRLTFLGSYSHVSDDFFPAAEIDGPTDLALNAPASKVAVGLRYSDRVLGLSGDTRVRYVAGFPMNSGVYVGDVPGYTVVDVGVAYRLPQFPGAMISLNVQNLTDNRYRAFIGAPELGRLVLGRMTYTF